MVVTLKQVFITPELKKKYIIAQAYLRRTQIPLPSETGEYRFLETKRVWIERFHADLRYYYVALVQSIVFEQQAQISYTPITMDAVNLFLRLFHFFLRWKIIEHISFSQLYVYVMEHQAQLPQKTVKLLQTEEIWNDIWIIEHWNTLVEPMYWWYEEQLSHVPGLFGLDKQWVKAEKRLTKYFEYKQENPIILLETVRNLEHHSGTILGELFWTLEDLEELQDRLFREKGVQFTFEQAERLLWQEFATRLSEDAFQLEVPYRFGINKITED
jgi:hypothetical protein